MIFRDKEGRLDIINILIAIALLLMVIITLYAFR